MPLTKNEINSKIHETDKMLRLARALEGSLDSATLSEATFNEHFKPLLNLLNSKESSPQAWSLMGRYENPNLEKTGPRGMPLREKTISIESGTYANRTETKKTIILSLDEYKKILLPWLKGIINLEQSNLNYYKGLLLEPAVPKPPAIQVSAPTTTSSHTSTTTAGNAAASQLLFSQTNSIKFTPEQKKSCNDLCVLVSSNKNLPSSFAVVTKAAVKLMSLLEGYQIKNPHWNEFLNALAGLTSFENKDYWTKRDKFIEQKDNLSKQPGFAFLFSAPDSNLSSTIEMNQKK